MYEGHKVILKSHRMWGRDFPDGVEDQAQRLLAEQPDEPNRRRQIVRRPGWSADAISHALLEWSEREAGRRDLSFYFDPNIYSETVARMLKTGPTASHAL